MSEWVAIAAEEAEEPVEVPTESDGTINLSAVTAQFPGATGLKYRHPETNKLRGVRIQGDTLFPPAGEEGWGPYTYLCVRIKAESPKKDESGLKRKTDNDGEMYSKNIRYDESEEDEQPCDLIILGLPYKTTQDQIREFFGEYGEVDMVLLKTKPTGESRGFAFIRFLDKAVEKKVCMQRHLIDGRWCDIKVPDSQETKKGQGEDNKSACKIFVGKITEDLTVEDLKEHFENFGQVRDVYIPTPFRQFAFVQFSDSHPAKSLRGKEHNIKGVNVRIGQAVPKSSPAQEAYGYGYGGGGLGYGGGQAAFGGAAFGSGGGFNNMGGGYGNSGFGASNSGGFANNFSGGRPGGFGGGSGGYGGGGPSGFGGGNPGGGGGPAGINFADIARWAIEMGFGGGSGGGAQGGQSWNQGGPVTRGGSEGRGTGAKFSGRRSNERRF